MRIVVRFVKMNIHRTRSRSRSAETADLRSETPSNVSGKIYHLKFSKNGKVVQEIEIRPTFPEDSSDFHTETDVEIAIEPRTLSGKRVRIWSSSQFEDTDSDFSDELEVRKKRKASGNKDLVTSSTSPVPENSKIALGRKCTIKLEKIKQKELDALSAKQVGVGRIKTGGKMVNKMSEGDKKMKANDNKQNDGGIVMGSSPTPEYKQIVLEKKCTIRLEKLTQKEIEAYRPKKANAQQKKKVAATKTGGKNNKSKKDEDFDMKIKLDAAATVRQRYSRSCKRE